MEAVKLLADRHGVSMPQDGYDSGLSKKRTEMYGANREAARFFMRSSIRRRAGRALNTFIRVVLPMIRYVVSGSDTLLILGTILKIILCQRVTVSSFCMRRIF